MASFSERYGYTKPSDVIIREKITPEIENAILSCFDALQNKEAAIIYKMEEYIWCEYFHKRRKDFHTYNNIYGIGYLTSTTIKNSEYWYDILNYIEWSLGYFKLKRHDKLLDNTINCLNYEFEKLNFAYRILENGEIIETTSKVEIEEIEVALNSPQNSIKTHLNKALELYTQRPNGDYRNSIKESISAVEAVSRSITGDKVLNFQKMEKKGVIIPSALRQAFEKLYGYTNDEKTGIRHALMDEEGSYVPQDGEALFMLVSCSAFINYLNKKIK